MKLAIKPTIIPVAFHRSARPWVVIGLAIFTALGRVSFGADTLVTGFGKSFPSPENATEALAAAAQANDHPALQEILGPAGQELEMSDQVQASNELTAFAAAFHDYHQITRETDTNATLEVGTNGWPFPVPLVQSNGQWYFDTAAGQEEVINRRVGRDELSTLAALRAYVDAQREYASQYRDDSQVLKYAQHILSTSGQKDGLYWPPELDGSLSPLGPLVAEATGEGYVVSPGEKAEPQPFHGYYFKILTRQGKDAPGGKYNYVINGNMIGGFAEVAWPADYRNSGVMTFIVNQQGKVFQKDLGPKTAALAKAMKEYNPDDGWMLSPD